MNASLEEKRYSGFWPLLVLSIAFAMVLIWQFMLISQQGKAMAQQIEDRKSQVQQSKSTQTDLEKLVRDLLDLAKKDDQAKAIVDKYKIRENGSAAGAAAAPENK